MLWDGPGLVVTLVTYGNISHIGLFLSSQVLCKHVPGCLRYKKRALNISAIISQQRKSLDMHVYVLNTNFCYSDSQKGIL